jgi:hypothetical protein
MGYISALNHEATFKLWAISLKFIASSTFKLLSGGQDSDNKERQQDIKITLKNTF